MKLLKIFGIVAGIHLFALILIFANPGCSTSSKSAKRTDSTATGSSDAVVSVPNLSPNQDHGLAPDYASNQMNAFDTGPAPGATPISFNPDAPAQGSDIRYSPTRPNTPVAAALKTEPVADVIPAATYTVVRGDSLWSIAKRNHLSVAELSAVNNLRATATLQLGQKLIIPGKSTASASSAQTSAPPPAAVKSAPVPAAKSSGESVTHVVKSGETLGAIARKYQVKVGDIATANNITDPALIRPGQELVIPGWKAPAPKPATAATKSPAPSPAFPASTPVDTTPSPVQPSPVQPDSNPIIFAPPSADKPLDEGFKNDTKDAPVIQVEESGEGPR